MKKFIFTVMTIISFGHVHAQQLYYHEIRLTPEQQKQITITPELAKELLLYSYITITDSAIIGESMNYQSCHLCDGFGGHPYDLLEPLHYRDLLDDWGIVGKFYYTVDTISYNASYSYDTNLYLGYYSDNDDGAVLHGYSLCSDFINEYAIVRNKNNKYDYFSRDFYYQVCSDGYFALINKQGKVCIPFKKFEKIKGGVYDNLVPVCQGGKWGFATPNGIVKIKIQYDNVRHFSEGLAAVKKDGKWGYIDTRGDVKIPFEYIDAHPFIKGVAVVRRNGTTDSYCDDSTIPGGLAVGLVDHNGRSTYDYYSNDSLNEMPIKEYAGSFIDESTDNKGYVKYTYYENEHKERVKHGYYVFVNSKYIIEGHYKDGKKFGQWLWLKRTYDKRHWDWSMMHDFIEQYNPKIRKKNPLLPGYYEGNQLFIINKDTINPDYTDRPFHHYDFDNYILINFINGVPLNHYEYVDRNIGLFGNTGTVSVMWVDNGGSALHSGIRDDLGFLIDNDGNASGEIVFDQEEIFGHIPIDITITFYKGVPMRVVENNESTGVRKNLFEFDGFTSVEDIVEIVTNSGQHLYKVGQKYYTIEPKDSDYSFNFIDIYKYSKQIAEPLSFFLNLPASWPVPYVKSPQLNFFSQVSEEKLKSIYYDQYGKYFSSMTDFSTAYSRGESTFMHIVRDKMHKHYQYLFCKSDEFDTFYNKGTAAFSKEIAHRDSIHIKYLQYKELFADFCDYYTEYLIGENLAKEINNRKKVYEENIAYFVNSGDLFSYYTKGEDTVAAEKKRRKSMYESSRDIFTDSLLYKDLAEFLYFYTGKSIKLETSHRRQLIKDRIYKQYGQAFSDMEDFDAFYVQGKAFFIQEIAYRKFNKRITEFIPLKLKEALSSKKDEIKQYLSFVNECVAISKDAYPRIVQLMVNRNEKLSKEWDSNGRYFKDEVEFYEAYISDDYKGILKSKKKQ